MGHSQRGRDACPTPPHPHRGTPTITTMPPSSATCPLPLPRVYSPGDYLFKGTKREADSKMIRYAITHLAPAAPAITSFDAHGLTCIYGCDPSAGGGDCGRWPPKKMRQVEVEVIGHRCSCQ